MKNNESRELRDAERREREGAIKVEYAPSIGSKEAQKGFRKLEKAREDIKRLKQK